jgi:hypothetical protein
MDTITSGVTPLRQRTLEDMRIRKLEARTQVQQNGNRASATMDDSGEASGAPDVFAWTFAQPNARAPHT